MNVVKIVKKANEISNAILHAFCTHDIKGMENVQPYKGSNETSTQMYHICNFIFVLKIIIRAKNVFENYEN